MPVSVSVTNRQRWSRSTVNQLNLTFSGSYTSGGDSFTANQAGLSKIDFVMFQAPAGYVLQANVNPTGTTVNVQVYQSPATAGALSEISGAYPAALTNSVRALVVGV